jgi:hypothetical protein
VDDRLALAAQDTLQGRRIEEVDRYETTPLGHGPGIAPAEVVRHRDLVALVQQALDYEAPDVPGSAQDHDVHDQPP